MLPADTLKKTGYCKDDEKKCTRNYQPEKDCCNRRIIFKYDGCPDKRHPPEYHCKHREDVNICRASFFGSHDIMYLDANKNILLYTKLKIITITIIPHSLLDNFKL